MSIKVDHLTKIYGSQTAVNDISFEVQKGEIVGFLGPNGAGKTTTMKMITGYLDANKGTIKVCDLPADSSSIEFKKKIGYLPESNPLYYDMYIREYLDYLCNIYEVKNKKQRIEEVIQLVGLTPENNKKIGQLSKGYKQRVGLAGALVHNPEVLILDEPTSGLDPNQIVEIRNIIKELSADKTVLFSSHIMQEVEAICDRLIIINKGNIVANDELKNLQNRNSGSSVVSVSFAEEIEPSQLKKLSEIEQINYDSSSKSFQLSTKNPEQLKKNLLSFSVENGYNISALQTQHQSLESVFKELTK